MSNSSTSSEVNIKYQNSNADKLNDDVKPQTTDTDYYFNMIANPNKSLKQDKLQSDSSELNELLKSDSSRSSKSSKSSRSSNSSKKSESRAKYDHISVSPKKNDSDHHTEHKTDYHTEHKTDHHTDHHTEHKPEHQEHVYKTEDQMTPQEVKIKKIQLLRKLSEIKDKGFKLSKEYDFKSSIEEMEYEYELLKSFADKRNGTKIFKSWICGTVSVVEYFSNKFDFFDFNLSGWSEHMSSEVDSWDDTLEELYEKYRGSGKSMGPEIKLMLLIIGSGVGYHFFKSSSESQGMGLNSVLASNPDILSKIINSKKQDSSRFMTPQEINIEKQKTELKKKELEMKNKTQQQHIQQLQEQLKQKNESSVDQTAFSAALNSNMFNSDGPQPSNVKSGKFPSTISAEQLRPILPNIRAPEQVKNILDRLNVMKSVNKPIIADTQDETSSHNDRLISEVSLSDSNKKGRKPKKANISIM